MDENNKKNFLIITYRLLHFIIKLRSSILSLDMTQKLSSTLLRILNMDEMSSWNSERVVLAQLSYISQSEVNYIHFIRR